MTRLLAFAAALTVARALAPPRQTLSRFMLEQTRVDGERQDLEALMGSIQMACKTISALVQRAGLADMTGYRDDGSINVQGEEQKKLDVITNDVLKNALRYTGRMGVLASEEEDAPVEVDDDIEEKYQKEVLVEKTRGAARRPAFLVC